MDKTSDVVTISSTTGILHDNDKDNSDSMLIFENGTILGAISCDSSTVNNNSSKNPISNNELTKSIENISNNSTRLTCEQQDDNSVYENILCNTSTNIIPNNNINSNNNNSCNTIMMDPNTNITSLDHNNELDSNNQSIYSNDNINNNLSDNNNIYISNNQIDLLNSSTCSYESRLSINNNNKRINNNSNTITTTSTTALALTTNSNMRKSLTKMKSDSNHEFYDNRYHPPQYTAIYFDAIGNAISTNGSNIISGTGGGGGTGNVTTYFHGRSYDNLNHQQQYSDLANNIGIVSDVGTDSNQYVTGGINGIDGNRASGAVDVIQRRRGCFRQWFTRPSLPFIIGILALGGVACTLGGIILGSTGLVEHSTQYLSAALLMIGIGVSLLVISGAIWRLSIPDEVENCPCFRHLETCRNCNSPYCGNRLLTTYSSYMYPEFQHRPPPPSYMTSLNECTVGLLFHHEVANLQRNDSIRISTPPPAYRSSQSLSVFVPLHAAVSRSQHSLIPELSIPLSPPIISESETIQMLSQSELVNNADVSSNLQVLPKVMSTVLENSCPTSKKDGVLPNLSDIIAE